MTVKQKVWQIISAMTKKLLYDGENKKFHSHFQDSLLTDIEDITKCIGGVRQSLEESLI